MNNYRYLIFTGANERAVIALCRYMVSKNILFSLIARPGEDKLKLTRYKKFIQSVRKYDQLDLMDMMLCIAEVKSRFPNDVLVYVPSAESINRMILTHRQNFQDTGLKITLCDEEIYIKISNKETFIKLTHEYGISSPPEYPMHSIKNIPFVAKPFQEFSSKTGKKVYPWIILNEFDYLHFLKNADAEDFFYQKYVDGESYYYLIQMYKNKKPIVFYQKNLLQQSNGKSIIAAISCECPDRLFENRIISALESQAFHGSIMIEVIIETGNCWIIEANPRLWGPLQLALRLGFHPLLNDDKPLNITKTVNYPYLWINGLIEVFCKGEKPRSYFSGKLSACFFLLRFFLQDIYFHTDTWRLCFSEIISSVKSFIVKRFLKSKGDAHV